MIKTLLLIGSGSFIGGISRYLLSLLIQSKTSVSFPYGTLGVNILGCFLIGLIIGYINKENIASEWYFFLVTGLLGGFTTFSAFSMESINLFKNDQPTLAIIYIGLSIILGLSATFLAYSAVGNN